MFSTDERRRNYPKQKRAHKFDKQLINVGSVVNNSQTNTSLFTATYPCVVMGIIVEGGALTTVNAAQVLTWYLHVVEQGVNIPVIAYGGSSFQPEQQVLCFGTTVVSQNIGYQISKKTKTGRKLKAGDQLYISIGTNVAQACTTEFTVQFFLKI